MVLLLTDTEVAARLDAPMAVAAMRDALRAAHAGTLIAPPRASATLEGGRLVMTAGHLADEWYGFRSLRHVRAPVRRAARGPARRRAPAGSGRSRWGRRSAPGAPGRSAAPPSTRWPGRTRRRSAWSAPGRRRGRRSGPRPPCARCAAVTVFSRTPSSRESFAARVRAELGVPARAASTAAEAVRDRDVVILATTSSAPVLDAADLAPGTHVNAVGFKQRGRAEFGPDLPAAAALIATDSPAQAGAYDPPMVVPAAPHAPPRRDRRRRPARPARARRDHAVLLGRARRHGGVPARPARRDRRGRGEGLTARGDPLRVSGPVPSDGVDYRPTRPSRRAADPGLRPQRGRLRGAGRPAATPTAGRSPPTARAPTWCSSTPAASSRRPSRTRSRRCSPRPTPAPRWSPPAAWPSGTARSWPRACPRRRRCWASTTTPTSPPGSTRVLAGETFDAHTPRDRRELLPLTPVAAAAAPRSSCPGTPTVDEHTPAHLRHGAAAAGSTAARWPR